MTDIVIPPLPQGALDNFSEEVRPCIERLIAHTPERHDLSVHPQSKLAAVLVLLYEQAGELRVLLTTRSKALRTHAGQTALPGGRLDDVDKNLINTAYREAHEEVALPLESPHIHTIGVLEPFISLHRIVVTPVLAILTHPSVLNQLRASENPTLARSEALAEQGTENWPYDSELYNTSDSATYGNVIYRMHRLRTSASPVKGLTADILIKTAQIAFQQDTVYERYAPQQLQTFAEMSRFVVALNA
ncbi:Nudix hydrolase 15, mitochondrial [Hypsizygus marmoreus]|uniref:Nudix hydrolase 15, mitochondrial n=1 Tax=Hypsizygus marmoreus TaxID=39966 RepID=A0A369K970_HYPMA|nr:Nudix hydrolase 15, mitochondrial [Hypsizygus marmoreus]